MKKHIRIMLAVCIIGVSIAIIVFGKLFIYKGRDNNQEKKVEIENLIEIAEISEENTPLGSDADIVVENEFDINIIPDEYNTGCDDNNLVRIEKAGNYGSDNLYFKMVSNNTKICLDFAYNNTKTEEEVSIENYSFIDFPLVFNNERLVNRNIIVTFTNCKFSNITGAPERGSIHYIFNNCTINTFYGSNATFNNCKFGGSFNDCMNPFVDVYVNNSYFRDLNYVLDSGNVHSDGVQVFGKQGVTVDNIIFENCRFEIPAIPNSKSKSAINACLMVQLEYSDANKIEFNNCKINGGGYSIYAWAKGLNKLNNVAFNNIYVGDAKLFGTLYPTVGDSVTLDVHDTESLYVSSVWKDENNKTHIIVSNDTCEERTIRVYYKPDKYKDYQIAPCLGGDELRYYSSDLKYSDFPFDIDIVLQEECSWIVCYDVTSNDMSTYKQIRCVNWSEGSIYIENAKTSLVEEPAIEDTIEEEIILDSGSINSNSEEFEISTVASGVCGKEIVYSLDGNGVLSLMGEGDTYNYNSVNNAPWYDCKDNIKQILISEGITTLGNQLFRNCSNVENLTLPATLVKICNNTFIGCSSLRAVDLPINLKYIGDYAFHGTKSLSEVTCEDDQWGELVIGQFNDNLIDNIQLIVTTSEPATEILIEGTCGENINYVLYDDGKLIVEGYGAIQNYNSQKTAPWYNYGNNIVNIYIGSGITAIGSQAFRNCSSIADITLPEGIATIGANSFIGCSNLKNITLPKSLSQIGNYAFWGTAIDSINYNGNARDWEKINIGSWNQPLVDCANELFGILQNEK